MNPQIIVSAIIRIWSLQQFFGAIVMIINLPSQLKWFRFSQISSMPDMVQESFWNSIRMIGVNLATAIIAGTILWIYAPRIAVFILKTLGFQHKINEER